jgi:aspartate/methionine/tyrosine aminotransferase
MFSQRTNWKLTPNKYTLALEEIRASSRPLIDLTVSNPTACGFDYDSAAILRSFQNEKSLAYEPEAKGLRTAREAVAQYYREDHSARVDPESLVLTTSTSEAYSFVFRLLCDPHDEILVPKPSYPLFDFLGDLQDLKLIPYALQYAHGWFIDFTSLRRSLTPRTRAILLVHPNNPTGSYVKPEEAAQLNALCAQRNLALIVDEVFLDYQLDASARRTFVVNRDALTFTLSGLSKISALPQMKVAWVATSGPASLTQPALERLEIVADTYLSLSSPAQWAFPELLAQRRNIQPQLQARVRANWTQLQTLARGKNCEVLESEGGWYGVLQTRGALPDENLAIEIMQKARVLVHPGHFYDFPSDDYLVVSLIVPEQQFTKGICAVMDSLRPV